MKHVNYSAKRLPTCRPHTGYTVQGELLPTIRLVKQQEGQPALVVPRPRDRVARTLLVLAGLSAPLGFADITGDAHELLLYVPWTLLCLALAWKALRWLAW